MKVLKKAWAKWERRVKIGRRVRQGRCFFIDCIQLVQRMPSKEALEESGDFRIGEQAIFGTKYADDIVLTAEEKRFYRA
jgi:hypothetical protein